VDAPAKVFASELKTAYPLTGEQIDKYQKEGYIKLKDVFSAELLEYYRREIRQEVENRSKHYKALEERDTYGKAFLQIFNLWRENENIRQLCLSKRLGRIAAELMQVNGVRMYHDQALFKEPGGGYTPWHADQFYWPLSNDNSITAWIPLQATPLEMGPLSFAIGSQEILQYRDLEISDDSEAKIGKTLHDYAIDESAYDLGEVSFHSGWIFHRAGPNKTDRMRAVMTVIMMEDGIRLIEPRRPQHAADWKAWMPGTEIGRVVDSPLNPVLYSRQRDEAGMG
jgi:ectoine hydroxylase-related dioxygenase (phytanoyl-CoA dioxygenase family)